MSVELDNKQGIIRASIMGFSTLSAYQIWSYMQDEFSIFKALMLVSALVVSLFYVKFSVRTFSAEPSEDQISKEDKVVFLNGRHVVISGGVRRAIMYVAMTTAVLVSAMTIKIVASR